MSYYPAVYGQYGMHAYDQFNCQPQQAVASYAPQELAAGLSASGYPMGSYPPPAAHAQVAAGYMPQVGDAYAAYYHQYAAACGYAAAQPHPGYGSYPAIAATPAPGYGPPLSGYATHYPGYGMRGLSPRRETLRRHRSEREPPYFGDRDRGGRRDSGRDIGRDRDGNKGRVQNSVDDSAYAAWTQVKNSLEQETSAQVVWIEAVDPPRRNASMPNVSLMIVSRIRKTEAGNEDFTFQIVSCRSFAIKQERHKECSKEFLGLMDLFPFDISCSWCQLPADDADKKEVDVADWQRLAASVAEKVPSATIEILDPSSCLIVSADTWCVNQQEHAADVGLAVLDRFEAGFAEVFKEATRVSGIVRKMWYLSVVCVRPEKRDGKTAGGHVPLGVGLATEANWSKARAVHAATRRVSVLRPEALGVARKREPRDASLAPASLSSKNGGLQTSCSRPL